MPSVVQYIFVNKGLGMSAGKLAAQAAHASVESYRISDPVLIERWYEGKHYTKLVMQARDERHLETIERYLTERGIKSVLIIDEGMTEIDAHQMTALGVEIVDKEAGDTAAVFSTFELYRDTVRVTVEIDR